MKHTKNGAALRTGKPLNMQAALNAESAQAYYERLDGNECTLYRGKDGSLLLRTNFFDAAGWLRHRRVRRVSPKAAAMDWVKGSAPGCLRGLVLAALSKAK